MESSINTEGENVDMPTVGVQNSNSADTPRPQSLRSSLLMFKKKNKKQSAPSSAARAANCIAKETMQKLKFLKNEERRKVELHEKELLHRDNEEERKKELHQKEIEERELRKQLLLIQIQTLQEN